VAHVLERRTYAAAVHRDHPAGGFDGYFAQLSPLLQIAGGADPAAIGALAAAYGIEFDFARTPAICERFGLHFG